MILSLILVTFPTVASTLTYHYCAEQYELALLLAVISVYCVYKKRKIIYFFIASLCFAFSMGIYQCYIGVTIGLCILIPIIEILRNDKALKEIWKDIIKSILMVALGFAIYYSITHVVLKILNLQLASYSGANDIGMSTIKNVKDNIIATYKDVYRFFFKDNILKNSYYKRQYVNLLMFGFIGIANIILIIKNKTYKDFKKIFCLILFNIMLPIGINIIKMSGPTSETVLRMTMSFCILLIYACVLIEIFEKNDFKSNIIKWSGTIVLICIIVTYILTIQCTYMARQYTYNQAYSTMVRIIDRIETTDGYKTTMKICIAGTTDNIRKKDIQVYKMATGEVSDYGEFWTGYTSSRSTMKNFLLKYLGVNINWCSDSEYTEIINSEEFKEMEIFPESESVKIISNVVVVKLTNNPPAVQ